MANIFALSPGVVHHAQIINYSTRQGQRLFEMATKPLNHHFALDHKSLQVFLEQLGHRATVMGWGNIIEVPPDLNNINQTTNLITRYGSLSLEQVRAHAMTYVNGNNRAAQDSFQMYECIFNSLTKSAQSAIALLKQEYTVGNAQQQQVSGTCLLKVVIRKSHVDTNATTSLILAELSRIDKIVLNLDSNIEKVNDRVKALVDELAARGQTRNHLLTNLFQGYKVASNKTFVAYIKNKQDQYNENSINMEANKLMDFASNYYATLVESNKWGPTKEEEEDNFIAMRTQFKKLEHSTSSRRNPRTKRSY